MFEYQHKGEIFQIEIEPFWKDHDTSKIDLKISYGSRCEWVLLGYVAGDEAVFKSKSLSEFCDSVGQAAKFQELYIEWKIRDAADWLLNPETVSTLREKVNRYWNDRPDVYRPSWRWYTKKDQNIEGFEQMFIQAWSGLRTGINPFDLPKQVLLGELIDMKPNLQKFVGNELNERIDKMFEEAEFGDIEW